MAVSNAAEVSLSLLWNLAQGDKLSPWSGRDKSPDGVYGRREGEERDTRRERRKKREERGKRQEELKRERRG